MLVRHEVLERFVECQPKLRSFALKLTGSVHDAEDLVQETMLRACEKWEQYNQSNPAGAWLSRILYRIHIDLFRRKKGHFPVSISGFDVSGKGELPEDILNRKDESEILKESMGKLSPEQCEVLRLRYLEGCTIKETADSLDIPTGTVKSRGHDGILGIRSDFANNKRMQ